MEWRRACRVLGLTVAAVVGVVAILLAVALVRALTLEVQEYGGEGAGVLEEAAPGLDLGLVMAGALAIPTVSTAPGDYDTEQLLRFHQYLRDSFPRVFSSPVVEVEVVNNYSLLLTVKGRDTSLAPYLLAAHMDVVPVDAARWTHDPWGGQVHQDEATGESYVWGRGAIDDKLGVVGIMSALESLLAKGFSPLRSFYVALGHDEEVGGLDGAGHMGALLQARGAKLAFVLDEGLPVLKGVMKGVDIPVATIGVTEKGWMRVRVSAEGEGGHSSIPPQDQAVARLARALTNLHNHPQPSMFGKGSEVDLLTMLAPKASWPLRLVYSNLWLFGPVVAAVMAGQRETNALIRTTTATTIVRAGVKENVVPATAWAIVNHRVHPAQSLDHVLAWDVAAVGDPMVKVVVEEQRAAHPVSPYGGDVAPWRLLASTVAQVFPGAVTAPGVLVGNTDTVHYLGLTQHVYRFLPVVMTRRDIATIHGDDERVALPAIHKAFTFYSLLITAADQGSDRVVAGKGHRAGEL